MFNGNDYGDLQELLEDDGMNFYVNDEEENNMDYIDYIEMSEFGSTNTIGTWKDLE